MKKSYSISIPKPCSEDWDTFTPKDNGRHCGTCNKVVVDFTALSDREILEFLQNKKSHTCGRFRQDQMKTYEHWLAPQVNPGIFLLKAGFMSLMFALTSNESSGQESSTTVKQELTPFSCATAQRISSTSIPGIKGIVREAETGMPLPGVNVFIRGTNEGTATDQDGKFEFTREFKEGDILVFSFIGYKTVTYSISDKQELEMNLSFDMPLEDMVFIAGEISVAGAYEEQSRWNIFWNKVKDLF